MTARTQAARRALIVVLDALRPEFVTPDLMPNLTRLAGTGVRYANARSTFPTETRVNQSAVLTGCRPAKHGIVANTFLDPSIMPGAPIRTARDMPAIVEKAGPDVIARPTLGQILARQGKTFAALSSGTPGGGYLIHHCAQRDGGVRFAMKGTDTAWPAELTQRVADRFGAMPAPDRGPAWINRAVDIYLKIIEAAHRPDVMLLWLSEPDEAFHYDGIGSPRALEAIRAADAALGRVLDSHADEMAAGRMHVVVLSDHGQVTLAGEPLDLVARLKADGFRAAPAPGADVDVVPLVHNAGGFWVRDHDPRTVLALLVWLCAQPWAGPVFTRSGAGGTLPLSAVGIDHPRAPDIALALRVSDAPNAHGVIGITAHDAPYPVGGGCHGGLSRHELETVLVMAGAHVQSGCVIEAPAGTIDVMPTMLHALGLAAPDGVDGRVLSEAFVGGGDDPGPGTCRVQVSDNTTGPRTRLETRHLGDHLWIDQASVLA